MSIKKLLTLFVALCMIFIFFAGCGQNSADPIEQSDESEEAFPPGSYAAEHKPPEIEDTGATADDIVNPYDHKDVDDLTDKEIDMIYILQNKSFDYYLDSMWELYYECIDERALTDGLSSRLQFNFMNGMGFVQSVVSDMFQGEFILEDNKLTIPMDPAYGDDVMVFDIVDGNKLSFNKEMSSPEAENSLVHFGPGGNPFDLDGIIFEIDIPQTIENNNY